MQFLIPPHRRGSVLARIHDLEEREWRLQTALNDIHSERLALIDDVRKGLDTIGTPMKDFVFISCNGTYDQTVVMQYQAFESDLAFSMHRMQQHAPVLFTLQRIKVEFHSRTIVLRCVRLATLTGGRPSYNLGGSLIEIPVEPYHLIRVDSLNVRDGLVRTREGLIDSSYLHIGPLSNEHSVTPISFAGRNDCTVSEDTPFLHAILPCKDEMVRDLGVQPGFIKECMRIWIKLRTEHFRPHQ